MISRMLLLSVVAMQSQIAAQQVWRVCSQVGSGAHFADLPAAVAAANPGDEIRVYIDQSQPGGFPLTSPIVTKPLRIVGIFYHPGFPGYGGFPSPTHIPLSGPLVIYGIPAGQRVEISGFGLGCLNPSRIASIVAVDCQGDILLEGVYFQSDGWANTFVHFERCQNVILRGCEFHIGGYPVKVIDSNVLLTTTTVQYTLPLMVPFFGYTTMTESLRVINSTVSVIGSLVEGPPTIPSVGFGQPGVYMESGVVRVGPASLLRSLQSGVGGLWMLNPAVCEVRLDPRGTIHTFPASASIPEDIHSTYHSWAIANENFGVTVAGPANGFALLVLGNWQPNTPSPLGPLAMDPSAVFPIDLVPLPAPDGFRQWTLHCPLQTTPAHAFALQALTIASTGALGVTEASPLIVGWYPTITP